MFGILDLFSGIGGFSHALRPLGRTVAYCDAHPTPRAILRANIARGWLDDAPIFDDVCTLDRATLEAAGVPPPSLITAGFPCQDISSAGKRAGLEGAKSRLFYQIERLLRELPSVEHVLLENSPCVRHSGLDRVIASLRGAGMHHIAFGVFAASDCGALHQRKRWLCVASRNPAALPAFEPAALPELLAWDWLAEPVPRVVPRDAAGLQDIVKRCSALGNSVVPQCVRRAYHCLSRSLATSATGAVPQRSYLKERHGSVHVLPQDPQHPPLINGSAIATHRACCVLQSSDLLPPASAADTCCARSTSDARGGFEIRVKTQLDGADGVMVRRCWPTPLHSPSHYYTTAPIRCLRSRAALGMCILHERDTLPEGAHAGAWVSNPEFIEHLMGYPPGFTARFAAPHEENPLRVQTPTPQCPRSTSGGCGSVRPAAT